MPKRVDANQREIVKTFRDLGASVHVLSDLGKGCPDIVVGLFGKNYLIEIKDGSKVPSAQRLTDKEQLFFDGWKGHVQIIKSVQEVVYFVNNLSI